MRKDRRTPWDKTPEPGAGKRPREAGDFDDEIIDLDEIVESPKGRARPAGKSAGTGEGGLGFSLKGEPGEESLFGERDPEDDPFAPEDDLFAPDAPSGKDAASAAGVDPETRLAEAEAELEALIDLTEVVEEAPLAAPPEPAESPRTQEAPPPAPPPDASAAAARFAAEIEERILALVRETLAERLPGLVREALREEIDRLERDDDETEPPRG